MEELLVSGELLQEGCGHGAQLAEHSKGDVPQLGQSYVGKANLQ